MANSFFRFKQFLVKHDKCAMKVGTDGVLLGAWSNANNCNRILDIGTGTGLIALMLAQRNKSALIDAIDIEISATEQAMENVKESPFSERIQVHLKALSDYTNDYTNTTTKYDLIVSNPPYFNQSLHSPNQQRTTARHTDSLSLEELLSCSVRLISDKGRISLIIPSEQEQELNELAELKRLTFIRKTHIIPKPEAHSKRLMAELTPTNNIIEVCTTDKLLIEESRHKYSPEYIELTKDFYLNF